MRARTVLSVAAACLWASTLSGCLMIPVDPSPEDYYIQHADDPDKLSELSFYQRRMLVLGFYPGMRAAVYHDWSFGRIAGETAAITLFNVLFLLPTIISWVSECADSYTDTDLIDHAGYLAILGYFKTCDRHYRWADDKALEPFRAEGLERIQEGQDFLEVARDIGERSGVGTSRAILDLWEKANPVELSVPTEVDPAEKRCREGRAWMLLRDYPRAAEEFRAAIRLDPENPSHHTELGTCLLEAGRVEEAVSAFDDALKLDPQSPLPLKNRAIAYIRLRRLDEALSDLAELVEVDPSAEAYLLRAMLRAESGDCDLAVVDFGEAIRHDPQSAEAYYGRGVCRAGANQLGPAIADFTEAIRCREDYVEAYHNRAMAYVRLGSQVEALADLNKAIEIRPTPESHLARGFLFASRGETARGIEDYTRAIELRPAFGAAYYQRGFLYQKQGELEKALADLKEAQRFGAQVDPSLIEVLELQREFKRGRQTPEPTGGESSAP